MNGDVDTKKKLREKYEALFPVPVILVTYIDKEGEPNIVTVAWTGVVSSSPPALSISLRPSRYSFTAITSELEFVVNIPTEDILEKVDYCGLVSGRNVNKFLKTGLSPIEPTKVRPPLIKECPVNIECKLKQVVDLGAHHLFIGDIVCVHVDEGILNPEGEIDYSKTRPVVYNQGEYWSLGEKKGYYGFSAQTLKPE